MSCPYLPSTNTLVSSGSSKNSTSSDVVSTDSTPVASPQLSSQVITVEAALNLAKTSCPAFQSSCPFRNVKDAEEMRKAMLNLPKSHYDSQHVKTSNADKNTDTANNNAVVLLANHNRSISGQESVISPTSIRISDALRVALQHVHNVSHSLHDPSSSSTPQNKVMASHEIKKYEIAGGCPFKTLYVPPSNSLSMKRSEPMAFVEMMEKFSLSAIMAGMIHLSHDDTYDDEPIVDGEENKITENFQSGDNEKLFQKIEESPLSDTINSQNQGNPGVKLSMALKTGTAASHSAAESVHFVKEFIQGNIDRTLYSLLIVDLYHIYHTLETELEVHALQCFPSVHFPNELNRTASLADDVEFFHGLESSTCTDRNKTSPSIPIPPPTKAAQEYQNRIRYIANTEPLLLLSHAYTRYLGDLSGGRILARVARRALNLTKSSDGLRFYEFENVASPKVFKDQYRRALDEMNFSVDVVERLVAEANVAFVLNMRVFEEFDVLGGVKGAFVRPLEDAIIYYDECIRRQELERSDQYHSVKTSGQGSKAQISEVSEAKCPFAFLGGPNPHKFTIEPEAADRQLRHKGNDDSNEKLSTEDGVHGEDLVKNASMAKRHERCPWPFIFFHDPMTGLTDYQTWILLGLFLCWVWTSLNSET